MEVEVAREKDAVKTKMQKMFKKKWFVQVQDKNAPIIGPILKLKSESLAAKVGKRDFEATDG